jgi:hypothetical protein
MCRDKIMLLTRGVDERVRRGVDGCRRDPDNTLRVHETTRTTTRDTRQSTRLRARIAR